MAFKTREGAPNTFMWLMNQVLKPFSCKFIMAYFYDILIYCPDELTHVEHLREELIVLRKNRPFENLKKCSFTQSSLYF